MCKLAHTPHTKAIVQECGHIWYKGSATGMSVWITIQHCVSQSNTGYHNPTLLPPHPSSRPFRGNKEQRDFKKILSSAVAFLLNMFLCQHYHMFFVCQYIDSVLFTNKNAQSALSGKCIHQKKGKNCNLHCHDWEYSWIRCHENGWRKRQAGNETISGFVAYIAFQAFESASACEFFASMASLLINIKMTLTTRNEKSRQS